MSHKKILIGAGIGLFIMSWMLGYVWSDLVDLKRAWIQERRDQSFISPNIPQPVVEAFSVEFSALRVATTYQTLPDTPFKSADGKDRRVSDFAGKPILVNFWATWCTPCVVELPALEKLKNHYEGRLNVLAIAIEEGKTIQDIAAFLDKRRIGEFAGYLDPDGEISRNLSIHGLPTSFLIGSDGAILYRFEGDADWTAASSRAFFDAIVLQNK